MYRSRVLLATTACFSLVLAVYLATPTFARVHPLVSAAGATQPVVVYRSTVASRQASIGDVGDVRTGGAGVPKPHHVGNGSGATDAKRLVANSGSLSVDRGVTVQTVELLPGPNQAVVESTFSNFPGMSSALQQEQLGDDQKVWPPDTQIAVNDSYVVELVNSSASIWTRSGSLVASRDLNEFFPVGSGYSFSDPRVVYDQLSSRWFVSGMAFDNVLDGETFLGVSQTSDPTSLWTVYTVETNTVQTLYDQPRLGVSSDKIVMSWDDYSTGTTFLGAETWVLEKSALVNLATSIPAAAVAPDPLRFAVVPAQSLSPTTTEYLVYNNSDQNLVENQFVPTLGVVAITGLPSQNNVLWTESDPAISATTLPPDARQPQGAWPIATNDDRLLSATFYNGTVWTDSNDGCIPAGDTLMRSCLRLVQIGVSETNATVLQSFDVASIGMDLYYPSTMVDTTGDAFVAFTSSSTTQFASMMTVAEAAGSKSVTALTTLRAGVGIADTCSPDCQLSPVNNNRWGDYSGSAPDPSNPSHVWIAAEYTASGDDPTDWGTGIAEVTLQGAPSATPTSTATWTATLTASPTITRTPSPTLTPTVTTTWTRTATTTMTATPTITASPTWTGTSTSTSTPTATFQPIELTPGVPTAVSTTVGSNTVDVTVPGTDGIAALSIGPSSGVGSIVGLSPLPGVAIQVIATDANGLPIHQLAQRLTITISFDAPSGFDPLQAQIYTIDLKGNLQGLSTRVTFLGDGMYSASATTGHLSPFIVFGPPAPSPSSIIYLPIVVNQAVLPGW